MMRRLVIVKRSAGVALMGALALLSGCKTPATAGEAPMSANNPSVTQTKVVVGTLSLKGSDFNAWWALADEQGNVWRLVTTSDAQRLALQPMQHKRVTVTGKMMGKLLAHEQLQVEKVALAS
jgi:uncharacterized lipoprotein YajG